MKSLVFSILAGMSALVLIFPNAKADEWNKKTVFTFSGPVEVPGQVLPAGSYVFKLADSQADRHIVQVFNTRENHIYGTFLAIPDYRAKTPDKPVIVFEERAADAPPAIKAWFYPGDNYGDEFVYPKVKATEMAYVSESSTPAVPAVTENSQSAETATEAPAMAMEQPQPNSEAQSNSEEQEVAPVSPPAQQEQPSTTIAPTESTPSETAPSENSPRQLPKTASPLPLIGLLGFVSLGAGWSLRAVANRVG